MSNIWKVRSVKPYENASNHLFVGEVLNDNGVHLTMDCITFHYNKLINGYKDIMIGNLGQRIIPWNRIELANVLPEDFNFRNGYLKPIDNDVFFTDGTHSICIARFKGLFK